MLLTALQCSMLLYASYIHVYHAIILKIMPTKFAQVLAIQGCFSMEFVGSAKTKHTALFLVDVVNHALPLVHALGNQQFFIVRTIHGCEQKCFFPTWHETSQ